ncbi:hypothetical protein QUB68_28295 [Microcoleus sp. A006_D1]|uniref:hypothetical protein n=1 Tax=Microcoleus sp. A006_D1 TaxID=3055267 RepID=UPI002FD5BB1F
MRVTKIGYGCVSTVGDRTQEIYVEAELEDWEDFDPSLEVLRDKVAYELELADVLVQLHERADDAMSNLSAIQHQLTKIQSYWYQVRDFLVARGVDVEELGVLPEDPCSF